MHVLLLSILIVTSSALAQPAVDARAKHAVQLYYEVIGGKRSFDSLSADEKAQVSQVMEAVRRDCGGKSEHCEAACEAANELEEAAQDLARCAGRHNLDDDCGGKFNAVRSAHDEYQSTTWDAGDCD